MKKGEEKNYIIDESPEISVGERLGWFEKISAAFPAFQNRNYRLYFIGQLLSRIGTWLQIVAQSWLVWELTNSAFLLGVVTAMSTVPVLFFSLFGGVVVDRFAKKKILFFTQSASMVLAFILGVLTLLGVINVWQIGILAFLLGCVNAVDAPARQAFVIDMVNKEEHLSSAIALNSGVFNTARVIGPSISGFLIAVVGVGWTFMINGISYIAVIIALLFMHMKEIVNQSRPRPLLAIKEGISYSFRNPLVKVMLIFAGIISIFGWSYTTILPLIAEDVFHMGALGLSYLYTAAGLGAVVGVVAVSIYGNRVNPMLFILGGNVLFAAAIAAFTFSFSNFPLALFFLTLASMGLLFQLPMINATIQKSILQKYRGRVMSIYTLMFMGMLPLGSLEIGYLTQEFGPQLAILVGAIFSLSVALFILMYRKRIERSYATYKEKNGL